MGDGDVAGAPVVERSAEGGVVGASNLMGGGGVLGRNEFVAGGEDGDTGFADDGDGGSADGGGDGGDARADESAGGDEFGALREVAAGGVDVFAGSGWCFVEGGEGVVAGDLFVRDDCVAVGGDLGASHDFPTGAVGERGGTRCAGGVESGDGEAGALGDGCRGAKTDTIHHDAIVGREGAIGDEGGREDAPVGRGEGGLLGGEMGEIGEDEGLGFGG